MAYLNRKIAVFACLIFCFCAVSYADDFKDQRDKKSYKTVQIGKQVWMAENLNYAMEGSYCYNNDEKLCGEYGRLYTWEQAMKACPDGFRLPTKEDFRDLVSETGKQIRSEKWIKKNDKYNFNLLPAGEREHDGEFDNLGEDAKLWSSSEHNGYEAFALDVGDFEIEIDDDKKMDAFSVRCVKN